MQKRRGWVRRGTLFLLWGFVCAEQGEGRGGTPSCILGGWGATWLLCHMVAMPLGCYATRLPCYSSSRLPGCHMVAMRHELRRATRAAVAMLLELEVARLPHGCHMVATWLQCYSRLPCYSSSSSRLPGCHMVAMPHGCQVATWLQCHMVAMPHGCNATQLRLPGNQFISVWRLLAIAI